MLDAASRRVIEASLLFRHIGLEAVEYLLERCPLRRLAAGEVLIAPEIPNGHVYVVLAGQLRVYLGGRELPAHAILEAGDCAGELSLIDGQAPAARVIAGEDTTVLAIAHEILWSLVDNSHGVARNLLAILAGRVRHDNLTLVTTQSRSLEFEQAASVDALTGLHNRRWMGEAFPRAIQRCRVDGEPVCLVMADIDHFKDFNDRHGHLAGDAALRRVAGRLAASLRPQDLIARYGGEEFAVLLPQTGTPEAMEIAHRLRGAVATAPVMEPGEDETATITLSCGVAALRPHGNLYALIDDADRALYQAKAGGRNRVELATAE